MVLTAEEVQERLARQAWTSHNLELAPGVWTMPGQVSFLETNMYLKAIRRVLALLYGPRLEKLRVADLGCLEGGFSVGFAREGCEVVGVEVRPDNLEKCRLAAEQLGTERLSFVGGDVKEFTAGRFGTFDVVLALGILYHLDDPVQWIAQVAEATRGVLFLDTHFAPDSESLPAELDPRLSALGPLTTAPSTTAQRGRWFHEFTTQEQRDAMPWASWSNPSSFWLTKQSLLTTVWTSGFSSVWEVHDGWSPRHEHLQRTYPRCLLAAVKQPGVAAALGSS
jgi:SAM-dependent methyltransferase